jgi:hypothetical protein
VKLLPKGAALLPALTLMFCCGFFLAVSASVRSETVSQAGDVLRSAGQLAGECGSMAEGGLIRRHWSPDLPMGRQETVVHLDA